MNLQTIHNIQTVFKRGELLDLLKCFLANNAEPDQTENSLISQLFVLHLHVPTHCKPPYPKHVLKLLEYTTFPLPYPVYCGFVR